MGIGNHITIAMLRSPLHRVMSKALAVIAYNGRRTGVRYELPVQYLEDDGTLVVLVGNGEGKTWWRNFRTPAPVDMTLRGQRRTGKARLVGDLDTRVRYWREYLERYPYTTAAGRPKFLGERWKPGDDELRRVAGETIMVAVDLD